MALLFKEDLGKVFSGGRNRKVGMYECSYCGKLIQRQKDRLGRSDNCGCQKSKNISEARKGRMLGIFRTNVVGKEFGKLKVLGELPSVIHNGKTIRSFTCKCECGNFTTATLNALSTGSKKSCACLYRTPLSHGFTNTRIYRIWGVMLSRCNNKNIPQYKNYGGRGIVVCDKWRKFEGFYEDMKEGYSDNLSIDRINVDGNYCRENCRWVTQQEQMYNTTKTRYVEFNGERKSLAKWCRELGLDYFKTRWKLDKGIEPSIAFN